MIAKAKRGWSRHAVPGLIVSMLMASQAMAAVPDSAPRRDANSSVERARTTSQKAGPGKDTGSKFAASKGESKAGGPKVVASKSRRQRVQLASFGSRLRGRDTAAGAGQDVDDADKAYDPDRSDHGAGSGPTSSLQANASPEAAASGEAARQAGPVFQIGLASWYGGRAWNGHRTSDGGQFSDTDLTAAHATLPMGSLVRVTLSSSERSVVVRINDRPGTRRRIIDLSRAAAEKLGILGSGVAMVTLSPI